MAVLGVLAALAASACAGGVTTPTATPDPGRAEASAADAPADSADSDDTADTSGADVASAADGASTASDTGATAGANDGAAGGPDGKAVPEGIRLRFFDGSEGALDDYAGTPLVINFWASWCPPCIVEMPAFEAVHQEVRPDVAFLGINVGDEAAAALQLADRTGVTYPLAEDPDSAIFHSFGGIGMPTTVFVDATGMIKGMVTSRLRAGDLRDLIAEHLGV